MQKARKQGACKVHGLLTSEEFSYSMCYHSDFLRELLLFRDIILFLHFWCLSNSDKGLSGSEKELLLILYKDVFVIFTSGWC